MIRRWTIQRASLVGIAAGLIALLVAAMPGSWRGGLLYAYASLLALTAFCGLSVLWITIGDIRTRGRGGRMRPIRTFDAATGLVLLLPALYAFWLIRPDLGL